jgi:hypothetical protein
MIQTSKQSPVLAIEESPTLAIRLGHTALPQTALPLLHPA